MTRSGEGNEPPALTDVAANRQNSAVMRRPFRPIGGALAVCIAVAAVALNSRAAHGQEVTGASLKAAFLYHFTKFTEWPAEATAGRQFTMCVLGDRVLADELEQTIKGRQYAKRPMAVSRVTADSPLQGCHILYIAAGSSKSIAQVVSTVRDHPVLTVSDAEEFAKSGGITQLYFQRGRLRLFIDADAAARAHLKISSRLMTLSKRP